MSSTEPTPLDARGVVIEPGDTVIYGFGVGRSIAMAEAVVLGEHRRVTGEDGSALCACGDMWQGQTCGSPSVSLTPSGRVRVRVVRRSYSDGVKPVVDVAPDRLVVLKSIDGPGTTPSLPGSPLPTQAEEVRRETERAMKSYTKGLRATVMPSWCGIDWTLADYHVWCADRLAELRRKLEALDE